MIEIVSVHGVPKTPPSSDVVVVVVVPVALVPDHVIVVTDVVVYDAVPSSIVLAQVVVAVPLVQVVVHATVAASSPVLPASVGYVTGNDAETQLAASTVAVTVSV